MKILITGGTGFIGKPLVNHLLARGHELTLLTRNSTTPGSTTVAGLTQACWNLDRVDEFISEIEGQDAVINLAGAPIADGRWTEKVKNEILSRRVNATKKIVRSLRESKTRPRVLINASAVGYYGASAGRIFSEDAPHGFDFLAQVAGAWENEARQAELCGARVVRLRFGIVLGKSGGALPKMSIPFRYFLGASLGNGRQWMSWIHLEDLIGMIEFCVRNENVSGPVNAVSPNPVTNREFSLALARALHRPCWFSIPEFVLRMAFGEMSAVLLAGQRASSQKIESLGFSFQRPNLESALL